MKYYLIAGEASGDLHASRLMAAIKKEDPQAEFRAIGGDQMQAEGATLLMHYDKLAYMGILPVLLHLRTILTSMKKCRKDIVEWNPDALILVDYPGFNLRMAKYIHTHTHIPVIYYIAPKIWAWKEHRIKDLRRYVDLVLSILPFEQAYYKNRHNYTVYYVGNPTLDEIEDFLDENPKPTVGFRLCNRLGPEPIIALLPGSRKQEIKANLPIMLEAGWPFTPRFQLVVAKAPGIPSSLYYKLIGKKYIHLLGDGHLSLLPGNALYLLQQAKAAMITSGTATLEAAMMGVPQVVCYYMWAGRLASWARKLVLKVPYISLPNLIAGEKAVDELVAEKMEPVNLAYTLHDVIFDDKIHTRLIVGNANVASALGNPGSHKRAAQYIMDFLAGKPLVQARNLDENELFDNMPPAHYGD